MRYVSGYGAFGMKMVGTRLGLSNSFMTMLGAIVFFAVPILVSCAVHRYVDNRLPMASKFLFGGR